MYQILRNIFVRSYFSSSEDRRFDLISYSKREKVKIERKDIKITNTNVIYFSLYYLLTS